MKFLLSLLTLLLINKECGSAQNNLEAKSNMQDSLKGTYTIAEVSGTKLDAEEITISFDQATNKVSGFSGCNRFFGNYKTKKNSITFSNIASTKKYCLNKANTIERQVLDVIKSASTYKIENNILSLSADDKVVLKTESNTTMSKADMVADNYKQLSVVYEARSRGFARYVSVSEEAIKVSTDRSLQKMDTYNTTNEDWQSVEALIKSLNVDNIRHLKPPTNAHTYDGAIGATLTIYQGDVAYVTPTFDDGNPPAEIAKLVNKVLTIGEKVKKQ